MKPFTIGLTGSIGMGKSTTAAMFADEGVPVWDADAAVHRLYAQGGPAVPEIAALCPEAVREGAVDRERLAAWVREDASNLARLEAAVHPLVAADREAFIASATAPVVLLDIPLLFETGLDRKVDATIVVTVDPATQRERVLSRRGMTSERMAAMLERQMPNAEKLDRADYVIETSTLEGARASVQTVLRDIRGRADARNRAGHGDDGIRSRNR